MINHEKRKQVIELLAKGYTHRQIIDKLKCGDGLICRVKKGGAIILPKITRNTEFDDIPEAEKPQYTFKRLHGIKKCLILSDIHLPYHNKEALLAALKWGKSFEPNAIILNGDILDFGTVSKYTTSPTKPDIVYEIEVWKAFAAQLRRIFPNANIYFKKGNHEDRLGHYLIRQAEKIFGLIDFDKLLEFREHGIQHIDNNIGIQVGNLTICHGHEVYNGAGAINVAKVIYDRANDNILVGHFHRTQEFLKRSIDGKVKGCWTTGCLQDVTVEYAKVNQWNYGFAAIEFDKDGNFDILNKKIINGIVR